MATSGKIETTCGSSGQYDYWVHWKRNSFSIENNRSNITISLHIQRNDGYANSGYNLNSKPSVTLKVGGDTKSPTISYIDTRNGKNCTFATWTGNVNHNNNGSLNLSISASFTASGMSSLPSGSVSGTASIDTIPRASVPTLSASSVVMGSTVTINTNRASSSLTHDLTYNFNGNTGTIKTGVGASHTWTVPDLVSKIPNKANGTCTIYCKTKSGSTVIGTKSVSLTLNIPAKSTPSFSKTSVQMGTGVTIYTNRKSSGYTHKLTYSFGGASGAIGTSVAGSSTWTPSKELANYTGKSTTATCTVSCLTYNGTYLVGTSAVTVTLTVPSATVPSVTKTSINLGDSITIKMPYQASCYVHDITYTLTGKNSSSAAHSGAVFNGAGQEYTWDTDLSLAAKIPSATNGTITLTCKTRFNGGTAYIGQNTVSFTVTVPNNSTTQPSATMTLEPVHSLSNAFSGVYVQGKSKVKASYTASSNYSTIASYKTEILGKTSNSNPYTSDVLNNAVSIKGTITDARGYSTVLTRNIEVVPYAKPKIVPGEQQSKIICKRCNTDGTEDPGGVKILIKAGRNYSKVMSSGVQKNFCKLSYSYKADAQDDSNYSEPVEILSRDATTDYVSVVIDDIEFNNIVAYNIKLIAEDDVGETETVIITVPTVFVTWNSPPGGHGFTLGGYHDHSKIDVFDCMFDAEFEGNVSGRVLGLGALPEIPEGSDLNEYKEFGVYAVSSNATAKTLLNCPTQKAGTLKVWSANGRGNTTGDYVYIMQEYIPYDNSETYRRSIQLPSPTSEWEYGEWKEVPCYTEGVTDGWYWRKYTNGVAECWRRVKNSSRDITTPFGNMYYGNCDEVEFPFSFISAPMVNATVESGTALILMSWQGTDGNGTTTATKPASYRVIRPTTITGASFTIAYHAIGRWKE